MMEAKTVTYEQIQEHRQAQREAIGRRVREVWVAFCREAGDTKPGHLAPWEELSEPEREVDRQIGEAIALQTRYEVGACMELGCAEEAIPCYLPDYHLEEGEAEEKPESFYCPDHAFLHGFCKLCGRFWSGVESFDFGPGYCDNCRHEIEREEALERAEFEEADADLYDPF